MGLISFFGSSVAFDPATDIPSLKGKVILVTGGNSGLGKQSIIEFARHDPDIIWLAGRNPEKARTAINDIRQVVPGANVKHLELDLASFASIKAAAEIFLAESNRLDILMENAGIMFTPEGLTSDGYELQLGTNHMGHALLVKLLMPVLLKTAGQPGADVRVVVLSSMAVNFAPTGGYQLDTVKTTCSNITTYFRYGQSKVANALFARQLAKEYPQLTVSSIHPGAVVTNLNHSMTENSIIFRALWPLARQAFSTVENGARNQLWASVSKDVVSGEYYVPVGVIGKGPATIRDEALAKKLWDWTEEELKDHQSN